MPLNSLKSIVVLLDLMDENPPLFFKDRFPLNLRVCLPEISNLPFDNPPITPSSTICQSVMLSPDDLKEERIFSEPCICMIERVMMKKMVNSLVI